MSCLRFWLPDAIGVLRCEGSCVWFRGSSFRCARATRTAHKSARCCSAWCFGGDERQTVLVATPKPLILASALQFLFVAWQLAATGLAERPSAGSLAREGTGAWAQIALPLHLGRHGRVGRQFSSEAAADNGGNRRADAAATLPPAEGILGQQRTEQGGVRGGHDANHWAQGARASGLEHQPRACHCCGFSGRFRCG